MTHCRTALVYFSATDVTHTYTETIKDALLELGCEVCLFNVTAYASRQEALGIDDYDSFVFGFPVFADFAPSVINTWLPSLNGRGRKCVQFFTYGARTTGYAHFHTKQLLEQADFRVLFSAEFLGRHSFNVGGWRMVPGRPDEHDLAVAQEFSDLAVERFSQDAPTGLQLQKPFGYDRALAALENQQKQGSARAWADPHRRTEDCRMCGDCETECPTQAFNAKTGLSDPERCIECMRCVYICPDAVIETDERVRAAYEGFLAHWHLTEEMMEAKKNRIITEAWQTAF